jgi:hypothetical protein
MTPASHFPLLKVYQAGNPYKIRSARVLRWEEERIPSLERGVPLNFDFYSTEVNLSRTATSDPHLITQRAGSSIAWAGEILSSTSSREKEAWQDGNIN